MTMAFGLLGVCCSAGPQVGSPTKDRTGLVVPRTRYVVVEPRAATYRPATSCDCTCDTPDTGTGVQKDSSGSEQCEGGTLNCSYSYRPLLNALPDSAARTSYERLDATGKVHWVGDEAGGTYGKLRVTTDYALTDTIALDVWMKGTDSKLPVATAVEPDDGAGEYQKIALTVFVGVGVRVTAEVQSLSGQVKAGLGPLGIETTAERVSGTLTVQALGVSGRPVTAATPIPSDFSRASVEAALVAVGTIKSLMHSNEGIHRSLRVIGFLLPPGLGDQHARVLSHVLTTKRAVWHRSCRDPDHETLIGKVPKTASGAEVQEPR